MSAGVRIAWLFLALTLLAPTAAGARGKGKGCETHAKYTVEFQQSLANALYRVRSQDHLTQIIYQLIVIDREVTEHELAHYRASEGWAYKPVYDTVELYGKSYRHGGCVRLKPGAPLEIAYRAALAPKDPSDHDRRLAQMFLTQMQQGRR